MDTSGKFKDATLLNWAWNNGYLFCDLGITWDYRYDGIHYIFYDKV